MTGYEQKRSTRVALVTGGGRGIGLAIAKRLVQEGASVAIADIDQSALESAREALGEYDDEQLAFHCCDISTDAGALLLSEQILSRFKRVDILVNNAAILDWTAIEALTCATLQRVLQTNVGGAVACIRALLPALSQSPYPRIVNISSINGFRGTSNSVAYNASKASIISLTQSLAVELAPRGIAVNAVAPGFVDTRMSKLPDGTSEYETDWFNEVYIKHRRLPLNRPATPDDIAGPVAFLCSQDARYITGQVLVVDGGVTASL